MSNPNLETTKLIIWDWYKTLSYHHFYEEIEQRDSQAYNVIKDYLLSRPDIVRKWGKGELEFRELHAKFAELTDIPQTEFDSVLAKLGDRGFDVDQGILAFVQKFNELGIVQVVAADNFDVWDEFFLPQYSQYLHQYFSRIFSARRYVIMDYTNQKEFYKKIVRDLNVDPSECIFIDDKEELGELFRELGGKTITHQSKPDLIEKLTSLVQ